MLKVSEVVAYIENLYHVELMDFQKDLLKHIIAGDVIYTPRCVGRSMLYNGYANYLQDVGGKTTDFSVNPLDFDKVYTCIDIIDNKLMSKEKMENMRMENPKLFGRDFECKY